MGAISQIEINEILVGNPRFFGQALEILNDIHAETQCNLLFELPGMRVFTPFQFGKIVFFSHSIPHRAAQYLDHAGRASLTLPTCFYFNGMAGRRLSVFVVGSTIILPVLSGAEGTTIGLNGFRLRVHGIAFSTVLSCRQFPSLGL